MAFQFNQPPQGQAPAPAPAPAPQSGIASLPTQSSAQGGFAFSPQAAVQPPNTMPRAQPLTNEQLGINPQGQQPNMAAQFAQSMQAWQAARQAELDGIKKPAAANGPGSGRGHYTMAGWVQDSNPYGMYSMGAISNLGTRLQQAKPKPEAVQTPFTIAPIPDDPMQYSSYIAQQQAAFEAARKARGG